MHRLRKANQRGHFDHGWLKTYHTYSFAEYQDPQHNGFRSLRVINEDWIQQGKGFGTHSHRDMEILTYVLEGSLEHKDSMNNASIIRPGEIQRMTAGTGVNHSEFNPSPSEAVHLLQIWIHPSHQNLEPSYEQKFFEPQHKIDKLRLIASPDGREGSITVHQDVLVFESRIQSLQKLIYRPAAGRGVWLQVVKGSVKCNDQSMSQGDGIAVESTEAIGIASKSGGEFLLFDLA